MRIWLHNLLLSLSLIHIFTAASNDGYSESYAAVGAAGRAAAGALYDILSDSLGTDPYGLLYRGCC